MYGEDGSNNCKGRPCIHSITQHGYNGIILHTLTHTHTYCMIDSPHEDTKNWITGSEHSLLLVLRLEVLLHFTFGGFSRHSTIKQSNHKMIIIIIVTLM